MPSKSTVTVPQQSQGAGLQLVPLGTADLRLAEPIVVADGPQGTGTAGGLLPSPQGVGTLDVRLTLETGDGARVDSREQTAVRP